VWVQGDLITPTVRFGLPLAESTHPNIAALVDPLFAFGGKRVSFVFVFSFCFLVFLPSILLAKERVVQRSADRVS
jgi:hypothetical protein